MDRFIAAPAATEDWPAWRQDLHQWRTSYRNLSKFSAHYPDWVNGQYCQALVMLWDEELWNKQNGWQVDALLDRAEAMHGGWDHVVLWNNYPLSGVDRRNQFDYFNDLPGGLDGLKQCVAAFHRRGVKVMIDHKPWVPGIPEGFDSANRSLAYVLEYCDIDGVYLDCASHPQADLKTYVEAIGPNKVFASEATTPLEHLSYQPMSWAQFVQDSDAPGIMLNHWLERKFTIFETRRYYHHPIRELQRAWLSGGGHVVWENVFGYWASYSPRYCSWLRLCTAAQRSFVDLFTGEHWEPLINGVPDQGIYASSYTDAQQTLFTVCNRSKADYQGELIRIPYAEDNHYLDVISGQTLSTQIQGSDIIISGSITDEGIAGILVIKASAISPALSDFINKQTRAFQTADFSFTPWEGEHRNTDLPHRLVPSPKCTTYLEAPKDMCAVPAFSGTHRQRYRMRECGFIAGHDTELHVYDAFERECVDESQVNTPDLWVDTYPVTNAQFKLFKDATHYAPENTEHFLRHWHQGRIPLGKEDHPVVYVSLNDARAYAAWAGKRLPTDAEWQRACLGNRRYQFPWGNELTLQYGHASKRLFNDGRKGGTTAVTTYHEGISAYGCMDMIGNTWEWTESERSDGHTRYALLKGGCWYGAEGSFWLFDGGPRGGDWAAKLILMHDGWDRCATIGFRCVAERSNGQAVTDVLDQSGDARKMLGKTQ